MSCLFGEVIGHYEVVAANLSALSGIFPFDAGKPWHIEDQARLCLAVECLRMARDAEANGLKALERIVGEL